VIRAHKALAQRADEVGPLEKREVQFVVERECSNNPLRQIESEFFARNVPFAVWVFWPPEDREDHTCRASRCVFRMSPTGHAEFQEATGKTLTRNTCFCEHMGRVIE
jgi:hypothetical protein